MGVVCSSSKERLINPDDMLSNINNFYSGLKIRQIDINKLFDILKNNLSSIGNLDMEGWKNFLIEETCNPNYMQTSKELVQELLNVSKTNFNDESLPLLTLLFLANSDKDTFVNAFKIINLVCRVGNAGTGILDIVNEGFSKGLFAGINKGLDAIKEVVNVTEQSTNPNVIRKEDLISLVRYYINCITYLPVNILAKNNNEGIQGKKYYYTFLNNSFSPDLQKKYIDNEIFNKYNDMDKIDITYFFNDYYVTFKNDAEIRKKFLVEYIAGLSPKEKRKLIRG